jgi:hypothetical protein
MELRGNVADLRFPSLCANCGCAASERLTYTKTFERTSSEEFDMDTQRKTILVRVPFCNPCIGKHRAESPRASILANLHSRWLSATHALGALGLGVAVCVAAAVAVYNLWQSNMKFVYPFAIGALCLLPFAWAYYSATRDGTEYIRAQKQTGMTEAFDFSDTYSRNLVCTMKNEQFANAFRQLNQSMEYLPDPAGDRADGIREQRYILIAVLAISLFLLVWQFRKS